MSGLGVALREVSAAAERAAVVHQYAGLAGAHSDAAIVSGFERVADHLNHAADRVDPQPFPRKAVIQSVVMTGCWMAVWAAVLLAVPDPARPWVLATAVAGGLMLVTFLWIPIVAVRHRRAVRDFASAGTVTDIHDAITDLRTRISEIVATLEPSRSDEHLLVAGQIESALVWLDGLELDAGPRIPPVTREYRYRFGPS